MRALQRTRLLRVVGIDRDAHIEAALGLGIEHRAIDLGEISTAAMLEQARNAGPLDRDADDVAVLGVGRRDVERHAVKVGERDVEQIALALVAERAHARDVSKGSCSCTRTHTSRQQEWQQQQQQQRANGY